MTIIKDIFVKNRDWTANYTSVLAAIPGDAHENFDI